MRQKNQKKQQGAALIIAMVFMLIILVLVSSLMEFVTQNVNGTRRGIAKEQAMALAEAGVEKAVSELNATAGAYTGEVGTVLGTGEFDVSVQSISGSAKEIDATGYVPNKTNPTAWRRVKVRVSINTTSVSFNYGVQVGNGGLVMDNNTTIDGNVYSNGTIEGDLGAEITGDAFSAGGGGKIFDRMEIGGNAWAHHLNTDITVHGNAHAQIIDDIHVDGDVFANTISNCEIEGNASFTANTGCTIGGTQTSPFPGETDPDPVDFPITDQQINDWKAAAENGNPVISGNYTLGIGASATLGPQKITGNLVLSQNSRLTLTGPLYVVGNITTLNNSHVILDPAYGDDSEVIVSDGIIDAVNNTFFDRAGPDSFIMMVTTKSGDDVFKIANNVDALIVYAQNGEVEVWNRAVLREVTGYKIHVNNLGEINYESGLANINFSGGPGASWRIQRGTWRELK